MALLTKKRSNKIGQTTQDNIVDVVVVAILLIMSAVAIFPLYYTIVASLSNPALVATGKVIFWPKQFTLIGYEASFSKEILWTGYANNLAYTLVYTFLSLAVTLPAAYALSRKTLPYRGAIFLLFMIPMYFSGGTIPTFLVINELGLLDTFWVMVIPHGISTMNLIICRNYFSSNIPDSLFESATLDGASVTQFFFQFVIPLSKPIISVMSLYFAVPKWNEYMAGLLYITDVKKQNLSNIIKQITSTVQVGEDVSLMDPDELMEAELKAGAMRYAVIIVAALPLYILYPALQKYLINGVMVGAVKE